MKRTILAIAATALSLTACGANDPDAAETTATATATTTAPTSTEATSAPAPAAEPSGVTDEEVLEAITSEGDTSFQDELTKIGLTAGEQITITMWAESACSMAPAMGLSDAQVVEFLPSDVESNVSLTPDQAAAIWAAAKRHVC